MSEEKGQIGIRKKRQTGFFRKQKVPTYVKEISVNGINLFAEMNLLKQSSSEISEKYERIIEQMEKIMKDLEMQNKFLRHERQCLLKENIELREHLKQNHKSNSWNFANTQDIIVIKTNQEEQFNHIFHHSEEDKYNDQPEDQQFQQQNCKLKNNLELEGAQVDAVLSSFNPGADHFVNTNAHFNSIQIHSNSKQQMTPVLGSKETVVECSNGGNEAPLRVFYLLILQSKNSMYLNFLEEVIDTLKDDPYQLLPCFTNNALLIEILNDFLKNLKIGTFESEREVIQFLNQNKLIDILLISVLKSRVMGAYKKTQLETINEQESQSYIQHLVNHQHIYRALANEFSLRMERTDDDNFYRFYSDDQEEQLISDNDNSLQTSKPFNGISSLEISLNNNQNSRPVISPKFGGKEPVFRVKENKSKNNYEFSLYMKYQSNSYEAECQSYAYSPSDEEENERSDFDKIQICNQPKAQMYSSLQPSQIRQVRGVFAERNYNIHQEGQKKQNKAKYQNPSGDSYLQVNESENASRISSNYDSIAEDNKENFQA